MTPLLILLGLLSIFTVVSYGYYLSNMGEVKENALFTWGSFIDTVWFNEGNKI